MSKGLYGVLAVALVLVIAGGSFYGGMLFGKSQTQTSAPAGRAFGGTDSFPGAANAQVTPGARGQRANGAGNLLVGTIKEIREGSLLLADNNGKETQVKVTDTTLIEKNASVKLTDLAPGETLMVSGSTAADGTVTARSLQVAPQGRIGFGGPGAAPGDPNAPNPQATPAQ
jgi:hypothetical protein